ncbi:MAG: hypothetical protein J2P26_09160 [Nocardiopsaceae bacterium]|nr:hypothetical protein [Nocardiopsaceae bacterium]
MKWLVGILWFQTALNTLGAVLLFLGAQDLADHGEEGAGPLVGIGVGALVVAALLAVSAIAAMHGRSWGWVLTLVLEIVAIVGGLAEIADQASEGIIAIGLAGALISLLWAPETRQWYGRR